MKKPKGESVNLLTTIRTVDVSMSGLMGRGREFAGFVDGFLEDESGQDLLEFVLVAALLSLCAVAGLKSLAGDVTVLWGGLATALSSIL